MSEPAQRPETNRERRRREKAFDKEVIRDRKAYGKAVTKGQKAMEGALKARDLRRLDPRIAQRIGRANLTQARVQLFVQDAMIGQLLPNNDRATQRMNAAFGEVAQQVTASGAYDAPATGIRARLSANRARKRDIKEGNKVLKGALAQAVRDMKKMNPAVLHEAGDASFNKQNLRAMARGSLESVFIREDSALRSGAQWTPQSAQQAAQTAPVQQPVAQPGPSRMDELVTQMTTVMQGQANIREQIGQVHQALAEVRQEIAEMRAARPQPEAAAQQQPNQQQPAAQQAPAQPETAAQQAPAQSEPAAQQVPAEPETAAQEVPAQPAAAAEEQESASTEGVPAQPQAETGQRGGGRHRAPESREVAQPPLDPAQEEAARKAAVNEAWVGPFQERGTNAPAVAGAEQQQPVVASNEQGNGTNGALRSDDEFAVYNTANAGVPQPTRPSPAKARKVAAAGRGGDTGQHTHQGPGASQDSKRQER